MTDTQCPMCHGIGAFLGGTCTLCGGSGRLDVVPFMLSTAKRLAALERVAHPPVDIDDIVDRRITALGGFVAGYRPDPGADQPRTGSPPPATDDEGRAGE